MEHFFDSPVGIGTLVLLVGALLIACAFEFVNGFHDTANAVATVIYTHSLKPSIAVAWSGFCNFLGVYLGGIAVAMSIIKLLPVELLASSGTGAGLAMVLALLVAAILWNLGTWYFGLPASSSHTLIGAIVGVGLANSLMPGHVFGSGVNWGKVKEIGSSLVLSPIVGLSVAALLLMLARRFLKAPALHAPPDGKKTPPWWIRGILVTTCTGVSFAHGSNDGQKGVGLIMLILIGLLPADFALNTSFAKAHIDGTIAAAQQIDTVTRDRFGGTDQALAATKGMSVTESPANKVLADLADIRIALAGKVNVREVPADQRFEVRKKIISVDAAVGGLLKTDGSKLSASETKALTESRAKLRSATDYAPSWVLVLVALALGVGTMIGWKRIVVTVGEKIGKSHLTYSQGAAAEIVAMTTIGLSGSLGLPVSTTHVLSSGIAGTMVAAKSGLQKSTVRNIALAWVLTLPVAMILAGVLFLFFRFVIPDAHAATPIAHFDPLTEQAVVTVPVQGRVLRLHGSNTIGAGLAPALAEGFLRERGGSDVERQAGTDGHAWVVRAHLPGENEPVTIEIDAQGSETAFTDLASHACDLGMASRPITAEEARRLADAGLGDLTTPPGENVIGVDGIAVIVSPKNGARSISTEDLARLFSGDLGAFPASSGGSGSASIYARDDRSGTFDTFRTLVLGGRPLVSTAKRFADSAELANAVTADEHGIGFVGMAHVRGATPLAVSEGGAAAVVPTPFAVASEDYPLTRRLFLYSPTPASHPLAQDFVGFALSPEGQTLVAASGFVDLQAKARDGAADACAGCPPAYASATRGARRMSMTFRFRPGSSALDSRAQRDVERLAAYLHAQRASDVKLLGFSDGDGPRDVNQRLSVERAGTVASALEVLGVHASTLEGFGEDMPVASNAAPPGRQRNRRVEAWIVGGTP